MVYSWVLPLALYLISFIISFDSPRWYVRGYVPLLVVSWIGVVGDGGGWIWKSFAGWAYCVALFISCMVYGELYRLRPEPTRLTQYFLGIAAGGALEAWLCVLAPRWFDGSLGIYIALWGTGLLYLLVQCEPKSLGRWGNACVACWGLDGGLHGVVARGGISLPAKLALT